MEKRRCERFKTDGKYQGKLILADAVTIKDISLSGIRLEMMEYLTPDHTCRIEIVFSNNEIITPKCIVACSSFLRTLEKKDETLSIYGVGLKFIELTDSEKHCLEKNISKFAK